MEFSVEDISPVKKKVAVTAAPAEVAAALSTALALVKKDAQINGFRKGKIPDQVLLKRFHSTIARQARENLISGLIDDVIQQTGFKPVADIRLADEDKELEKGKPFHCSMELEVLPAFDLPIYEGLEIEEKYIEPSDVQVDDMLEHFRNMRAIRQPAAGNGPAGEGQIAQVDVEAYLDGEKRDDYSSTGLEFVVGNKETLPDFENLVKTIPLGHTGEGDVAFPEDFSNPELAGKSVHMKVTVRAINERRLPEADDAFAVACGYKDLADMRQGMRLTLLETFRKIHKSEAQAELLNKLIKEVDFPLPPSVVETQKYFLAQDQAVRMARHGIEVADDAAAVARLLKQVEPDAEDFARKTVLLEAIAEKENLQITPEELVSELYSNASKMGMDYKEYLSRADKAGVVEKLRQRLLCDKAVDLIYDRARITKVEDTRLREQMEERAAEKEAAMGAASGPNGVFTAAGGQARQKGLENGASEGAQPERA